MIIDMHANVVVPDSPAIARLRERQLPGDPAECTEEGQLKRLDAHGIDRAVVWCVGLSQAECRTNNDYVAAIRARHPDRFIGFANVYPRDPEGAIAEIDRAIGSLGLQGLKLHPVVQDVAIDDPGFVACVARAAEYDIPFVTHVNVTRPKDIPGLGPEGADDRRFDVADAERLGRTIRAYDSPRFQSAHMGGLSLAGVRDSSITFQTTGATYDVIQWAVRTLGHERVVFGADFPFFTTDSELQKVRRLALPEAETEAILSGNATRRVLREAG